jgi:CBS domain containing-hemolysin-like protein
MSFVIIAICLVGSAFFSSSETALMRLRRSEVEAEAQSIGGPAVHATRELLASTSRLLVTILIGNNVVNILGASVASAVAVAYLGPQQGVVVATLVMTLLVLVFCEILPKAVAAAHPQGLSRSVALPLYLLHQMLTPVHRLFDRTIEPLVRRVAGAGGAEPPMSSEELLRLVRSAEADGDSDAPLAIMGAAAEAADRTVEEIMVPRTEIVAFPIETPPDELLERMLEERYTRAPIYEGSIDRVLGVAHFKDIVKTVRGHSDLRSTLRPVLRVPERKRIYPLLQEMQASFVHLAVVKSDAGLTQGIVTQEDILEEIVGEIRDEFDQEELRAIQHVSDDEYESLGRVKALDFNRQTRWEIPSQPGDSLSGVVFNALGRAPVRGDVVRLPGYEIRVEDVSGTRTARVRLRKLEDPESGQETSR